MDEDIARIGLAVRRAGVNKAEILQAFSTIDRRVFMPESEDDLPADQAYDLGQAQTATAPTTIACIMDHLDVDRHDKVLEIGTGSGYQAALLSCLVRRLYTLDIMRAFHLSAQARFKNLGLSNIVAMSGDGLNGWPEQAPFDRVVVNAAARNVPALWLQHLKPSGFLLMPLLQNGRQMMSKVFPTDSAPYIEPLVEVDFPVLIQHESS
ncbi:MAG: protein-L-isoaspartate O-methyltransferase family protein [Parvibaculales bacterium]